MTSEESALPARLIVHDAAYALDGGTIVLMANDEAGRGHNIMLVHHAILRPISSDEPIPGRLYFDDELIPMRSGREANVLTLCRLAAVRVVEHPPDSDRGILSTENTVVIGDDIRRVLNQSPEGNLRAWLEEVIQFVESERYLSFAQRVEKVDNPSHR